ncbi:DUF4355 domain-containing protein [Mycobacterium gordonae]|nr:DUF4355 domain-containing protein [Mycobacterium gordonae]
MDEEKQIDPNIDPNADPNAEKAEGEKTYSEDEVNQRVQDALASAKEEQEKQDAEKSEAEKLKSMSEAERAKYEQDKREAELAARESALATSELKAAAATLAAEKGLPAAAVDIILGTNAEETAKRADAFKSVLDATVQAAVDERLKGKSPRLGGNGNQNADEAARADFAAALRGN